MLHYSIILEQSSDDSLCKRFFLFTLLPVLSLLVIGIDWPLCKASPHYHEYESCRNKSIYFARPCCSTHARRMLFLSGKLPTLFLGLDGCISKSCSSFWTITRPSVDSYILPVFSDIFITCLAILCTFLLAIFHIRIYP